MTFTETTSTQDLTEQVGGRLRAERRGGLLRGRVEHLPGQPVHLRHDDPRRGRTGHFGPTDDAPRVDLPVLAVQFGDATNVTRFALEVNALAPSRVVMTQVDRLTGQVLDAASQQAAAPALGAKTPADLLGAGVPAGLLRVGQTVATGNPEMTALCQGLHDRGEWFVNVEGELDAHRYGGVLCRGPRWWSRG